MGSVGVSALMVGTALLVVFALATTSIDHQLASSLDQIEESSESLPNVRINTIENIEIAIVGVEINTFSFKSRRSMHLFAGNSSPFVWSNI